MAVLATQVSTPTGANLTLSAASGGGDSFTPGSSTSLLVHNGDATAKTITIVVPGSTYGQANPDITLSVPAGGVALFGPWPTDIADPADGQVDVTYSATTSVRVAAVRTA